MKKILNILVLLIPVLILAGCDGIFPTSAKNTVPSDHNNNISGALHKGNEREEMTPDECSPCHTTDLNGKVSIINGVSTWANSCYQCHGNIWKRNENGGGLNKK